MSLKDEAASEPRSSCADRHRPRAGPPPLAVLPSPGPDRQHRHYPPVVDSEAIGSEEKTSAMPAPRSESSVTSCSVCVVCERKRVVV